MIDDPHINRSTEKNIKIAKGMKKAGYSIREIMRIMGYKSPRSIQLLLK